MKKSAGCNIIEATNRAFATKYTWSRETSGLRDWLMRSRIAVCSFTFHHRITLPASGVEENGRSLSKDCWPAAKQMRR